MKWTVIDSGLGTAEKHMATDADLLKCAAVEKQAILHHYEWSGPAATYGYFLDPYTVLDREAVEEENLQLARRPTGGGLVFHITDLAFSALIPAGHPAYSCNTLDNYAFINMIVIGAIERLVGKETSLQLLPEEPAPLDVASKHFCMAKPTKFDVVVNGKKVGGAAQRRKKEGFLHQGTIAIGRMPDDLLDRLLLPGTRVAEAMYQNTYPLLGNCWSERDLKDARKALRFHLQDAAAAAVVQQS